MRQRLILTVALSVLLVASTFASTAAHPRPLAVPEEVDSPPAGRPHAAGAPGLNAPVAPPAVEPRATVVEKVPAELLSGDQWLNTGPETELEAGSEVEDESARSQRTTASSTMAAEPRSHRHQPAWRASGGDATAPKPPPLLLAPPVDTAQSTTAKKADSPAESQHVELTEPRDGEPGLFPLQNAAVRELETSQDVGALLSSSEGDGETPRLATSTNSRQDADNQGPQQVTKPSLEGPKAGGGEPKFLEQGGAGAENEPDFHHQAENSNTEPRPVPSSGRSPLRRSWPGKQADSTPSLNTPPAPERDMAEGSTDDTPPSASMGIELIQPRSAPPPASHREQDGTEPSPVTGDVDTLLRPSAEGSPADASTTARSEQGSQPGEYQETKTSPLGAGPTEDEGEVGDGRAVGDGQPADALERAEPGDEPQSAKQEQAGAEKAEVEDVAVEDGDVEDGEVEDGEVEETPGVMQHLPEGEASANGAGTSGAERSTEQFSPQLLRLRDRVRDCLTHYYQRPESVHRRSPWGVMHSVIAYGVDTELRVERDRVNAIGWLCYNRPCRQLKLFRFDGRYPVPREGPGYQGHPGQFLSMLALSRVKSSYPMRVDGRELTVEDLIEYEKATCRPKTELTFKLIGLAHYLPSDATWRGKWGHAWSIPRLLQEELAQPIDGAACGGTHRLMGYSVAVKTRLKRGEPLEGQWLRAHKYVDAYHKRAIKLQNRDGSFSTNWFRGRGAKRDVDRRVQTTGHLLEWFVFSLPENELTDPRIVRAVTYLNTVMLQYRAKDWESGHRGHALRALALYNERVFGDKPGERRGLLAQGSGE